MNLKNRNKLADITYFKIRGLHKFLILLFTFRDNLLAAYP